MNRLETALHDASQQRVLSRSSSRRTSREPAARQLSRNSSTRRRSMASPTNSLRQSREGFESNLAAERSVLPAGLLYLLLDASSSCTSHAHHCFDCHMVNDAAALGLTRQVQSADCPMTSMLQTGQRFIACTVPACSNMLFSKHPRHCLSLHQHPWPTHVVFLASCRGQWHSNCDS